MAPSHDSLSRPLPGPVRWTAGQGVAAGSDVVVGTVLVVDVVDVEVLVEVVVDELGSVVDVDVDVGVGTGTGVLVVEVVVEVLITPPTGIGNVQSADAQSVGVAAWTINTPGDDESVSTWSG